MSEGKPIHVRPAFYARCYESLKVISLKFGYNLVLHGSLNRDMDLIAIPWQKDLGSLDEMIQEFADFLGGSVTPQTEAQKHCFPHGRISYLIDLNRGGKFNNWEDQQYYLDISVTPKT